jgi:hypothetical protein
MKEANGCNPTLDEDFQSRFPTGARVRERTRDCLYFKKERREDRRDKWRRAGEVGGAISPPRVSAFFPPLFRFAFHLAKERADYFN